MQQIEVERQKTDSFAPEKAGLNAGIVGGLIMIGIAAVWFYLGWKAGYIYYYPPILALIGIIGIVKGVMEGNVAGRGDSRSRRPGRSTSRGRYATRRRRR